MIDIYNFPSYYLPLLFRFMRNIQNLSVTQCKFNYSNAPQYEKFSGADLSALKDLKILELVGIMFIPEISFDKLFELSKLENVEYYIEKCCKVICKMDK